MLRSLLVKVLWRSVWLIDNWLLPAKLIRWPRRRHEVVLLVRHLLLVGVADILHHIAQYWWKHLLIILGSWRGRLLLNDLLVNNLPVLSVVLKHYLSHICDLVRGVSIHLRHHSRHIGGSVWWPSWRIALIQTDCLDHVEHCGTIRGAFVHEHLIYNELLDFYDVVYLILQANDISDQVFNDFRVTLVLLIDDLLRS